MKLFIQRNFHSFEKWIIAQGYTPFQLDHYIFHQNERDGLEMAIRQREERLRELQPQLKAVLESTKPVQVSHHLLNLGDTDILY